MISNKIDTMKSKFNRIHTKVDCDDLCWMVIYKTPCIKQWSRMFMRMNKVDAEIKATLLSDKRAPQHGKVADF